MKAVCVLAGVPVMQEMADTMVAAAKLMGADEVVSGDWLAEDEYFATLAKAVEDNQHELGDKEGRLDSFAIPEILKNNLDADVLFVAFCPVSAKLMDQMPNLKAICACRGGIENVDIAAATKRGVIVVNAAGRNANAVSDFTVGMMLACVRNIAQSNYNIRNGEYSAPLANADNMPDMEGKVVGLVGYGHIGSLVAKKLSGFDVKVITYDPYIPTEALAGTGVEKVEKDELFKTADIISVHARLTPDNVHMIGAAEIALMKPTAYFVNTARAGLVDYDALYDALKEHRIAAAALDVHEEEPLPADTKWLDLDNVVLTGHLGGVTADAQRKSPIIAAKKAIQYKETGNKRLLMNPAVAE